MQSALFKEFFKSAERGGSPNLEEMRRALVEFFDSVFGVRVEGRGLDSIDFPTFEEALGVLDLSELRGETLRTFSGGERRAYDDSLDRIFTGNNRIKLVRLYLVLAMSKAIADRLAHGRSPGRPHARLVQNLEEQGLLPQTVFVSTNYDLLIDEALSSRFTQEAVDYGVEFAGPPRYLRDLETYRGPRVRLLKLHGSLNWLYCPTCNNLKVSGRKVVMELIRDLMNARCDYCGLIMSPVIVPPTYYKDMSNVFLSLIWNRAENALREVGHVIFCGYSFPDADMHIKYLLKRAQTNRPRAGGPEPAPLRFTVINNPRDFHKPDEEKDVERRRYERFLGEVTYDMEHSFHDFAENPRAFY